MTARIQKVLFLAILLYFFLVFIALMGVAFKLLGKDFSAALIQSTSHPVVGLMIGMLATAIIQSSSTTTALVVGMVAAGALTVHGAVPLIMGANIGTTVTNTMVAMASVNRREEFRRSFAGATMHDFFNLMSLAILFPLEIRFGFLERMAGAASQMLVGGAEVEFHSPVKAATKPVAKAVAHALEDAGLSDPVTGGVCLLLALGGIFLVLLRLPKMMRELFLARAEGAFFQHMRRGGLSGILVGTFITVLVQSSSITTSLLVPMIGAGILPMEGAFAITLGANIGTTVTALLASTAGSREGVTIALVHLFFNIAGIALIYPVRAVRRLPIRMAEKLADLSLRSKLIPLLYLLSLFFLLPGLVILAQRLIPGG
ncbi:MAG: Na/Pi symporter [Gemmatimonadota bacterium]|nr:Na/Pi symporter [Gemmatimonadota bacterium]